VTLGLRYGARSDVGLLRNGNEDSMYAGPRLLAVADGMGGHAAGEVASRVAIETVAALDEDLPGSDLITAMRDAVETANGYLRDMVAADGALEGMGTTLTALLAAGPRLGLVHVGDSRAYLLRAGTLHQITHDHTLVQSLVDEGRITPEEATTHPQRSWITRALDGRGEIELDLSIREAHAGDRYLLCTDGLSGVVSEETMHEALSVPDPQDACDRLVELALRAGGPDNVTCIVADIVEHEPRAEAPIVGGAAAAADNDGGGPVTTDSAAGRAAAISPRPAPVPRPAPAAEDADDTDGGRGSRRLPLVLGGVVLLVVAGVIATWLALRAQYYVGTASGPLQTVAVYRGVSGSVVGIDLSSVADSTDIPVSALPPFRQSDVQDGIQAKSRDDAVRIVANLRAEACARVRTQQQRAPQPTPKPSPQASASAKPSASPSPSPLPSYCRSAQ
jgi:PPM family protein phosphatase